MVVLEIDERLGRMRDVGVVQDYQAEPGQRTTKGRWGKVEGQRLTLVDDGLDIRMFQQDLQILDFKVGHPDGSDQALLFELFHLVPSPADVPIAQTGRVDEVQVDIV